MSEEYIYKPPTSLPPGSTVITYLRDSGGPDQQESLGQQLRIVQDYCNEHGLVLSKIYSDTGSGRKTKNRDGFMEMVNSIMAMTEDVRPQGLLLWAYSRFSRDIVDFNFYLYGLLKHGLIVHSLTEEIHEGLGGQIVLALKAYTSADFSVQLGKQIKRAIADRVRAGYSNGGTAPKGYVVQRVTEGSRRNGRPRIGVKWIPDPEIAPLVRLAWELRAQGRGYAEIIRATGGRIYASKNSWADHFRNKSYLGVGKAGGLEVPDHHEPLITYEIWDAVKKVEAATPGYGRHGDLLHPMRVRHPSLLSGLSVCIYCGSAMVMHTSRIHHTEAHYRSYACGARDRQRVYQKCTEARRVNAPRADATILDAVLNRILSPALAKPIAADVQRQLRDTRAIDREVAETNEALASVTRKVRHLIALAEDGGDIPELAARLRALKQDQAELEGHLRALKAELSKEAPRISPEALALVFSIWQDRMKAATEAGDLPNARRLLAQIVEKIELGYKSAIIHYRCPLDLPSAASSVPARAHQAAALRHYPTPSQSVHVAVF